MLTRLSKLLKSSRKKLALIKIAAQTFEAGDFLNIVTLTRFWDLGFGFFEVSFFIKMFLIKKRVDT